MFSPLVFLLSEFDMNDIEHASRLVRWMSWMCVFSILGVSSFWPGDGSTLGRT